MKVRDQLQPRQAQLGSHGDGFVTGQWESAGWFPRVHVPKGHRGQHSAKGTPPPCSGQLWGRAGGPLRDGVPFLFPFNLNIFFLACLPLS